MSLSNEKVTVGKQQTVGERLLKIGRIYLAGQTQVALQELHHIGHLEFTDIFYLLDKLGPSLSRQEQRILLDLMTEVVILSQLDMEADLQFMRGRIKQQIRNISRCGEFIYEILKQINGLQNT